MTSRIPLPPGLGDGPFTTRVAAELGVGEARLRGPDLARPFHGVRAPLPGVALGHRARALQLRLPQPGFFCSITAALIQGMPLSSRHERALELHVGMPSPMRSSRCVGTVGHKFLIDPRDLCDWYGLRMTVPVRTWCDLATALALEDLVAAGDYVIHVDNGLVTYKELAAAAARHPGRRGRARLFEALALLSDRSRSRAESIIRTTIVLAGIDGLVVNQPIADARGVVIAEGDLCFPAHRVIFEYQGDYHRTEPDRSRKDQTRKARLAAAGWTVVEIAGDELENRRMLLQIIRDTLTLHPAR
ncbi:MULTISPECIES: DUF559 domain-containing protein [unclassified Cryobacterium]|uniref:DUF559 domain-containing protein n=2 Tax=unclassified Cryobacterium TaxID=2649013 RepID=UPI002AB51605|nr:MULTISPECIES: DUF559 domain-containing protein [unclassified Cryobacterium]MDY7557675.1 DUF559 domain-containing protein [Cryobacterium sp. 10C3]